MPGFSNRVHLPRPDVLAEYWRGGRDPLPDLVRVDRRRASSTRSPVTTCRSSPGSSSAPAGPAEGLRHDALQPTDLDHRLRVAEAVVRDAGRLAADHFARRELLSIDRKGAQDLVSEADRACEDLIVAASARQFPEDGFLGEERGSRNPDAAAIWVIDPIDGTHNFLTGIPVLVRLRGAGRRRRAGARDHLSIRSRPSSIRREAAAAPF